MRVWEGGEAIPHLFPSAAPQYPINPAMASLGYIIRRSRTVARVQEHGPGIERGLPEADIM